MSFDCDGFRDLTIDGEIVFSRDFIIPDKPIDQQNEDERVKATFNTTVGNWNDLVVDNISLPPFQVTKLKDFSMRVDRAVLDFSDVRNAPNFKLPENYPEDLLPEPNSPLWRGVYIQNIEAKLPGVFKKRIRR